MKMIGVLGGMSWESTSVYYRLLNQGIREALGGLHSAKILLHSVEFNEIAELQHHGDWQTAGKILNNAAKGLQRAGAEGLLIATNTMHKLAEQVVDGLSIPLLHIADSTGKAIVKADYKKVGLLATAFTMEQNFYKGHIEQNYNIEVIVPDKQGRNSVHEIIYHELCQGKVKNSSREIYLNVIESLRANGAQAIILGCTEIDLLISDQDTDMPLFDSTALHVTDAVEWMLNG